MFSWLESWDFIAIFMSLSSVAMMFVGRRYAQTEAEKSDVVKRTIAPALAGIGYVILHYYTTVH